MSVKQSMAAKAFGIAVTTASAEGAKLVGKAVGATVLPALLIEPTAAVLAKIVEVFVSKVFEETVDVQRQIDSKLDVILSEPLETAKQMISNVLQVEISNAETLAEIERQLDQSYDSLLRALTYADKNEALATFNVLAYLALVSAMKRGGSDFARLHVKRLRLSASDLRAERAALEQRAFDLTKEADAKHVLMDQAASFDEWWPPGTGMSPGSRLAGSHALTALSLRNEADQLTVEAAELENVPDQIEEFCTLVEAVMANRATLLRMSV